MYYPINLDLRGKKCLVVGGGKVAYQKVKGLLRAGGKPTVVSPRMGASLKRLERKRIKSRTVHFIHDRFKGKYLNGFSLVIVATDDRSLNSKIGSLCRKKKLLVNVVDQPEDCTFTVPSVFRRGPLTIAISTHGASPALSKAIRKDIEKRYGREFGTFSKWMGEIRKEAIKKIPNFRLRKKRFEKLVTSDILSLLKRGKAKEARKRIKEILYG